MSDYPDTPNTFGTQGLVDAILRLLEQEEISRAKARELMHNVAVLYARDICCPNCIPPAPDEPLKAPWAKVDWCDGAGPMLPAVCPDCGGQGRLPCPKAVVLPGDGEHINVSHEPGCDVCGDEMDLACAHCDGRGAVMRDDDAPAE